MVDLLPDLFFHLMVRGEGASIGDLVDKAFNRPWVLGNTDVVLVEFWLDKPKYSRLQLGARGFRDFCP